MSKATKHYEVLAVIFTILDWLCVLGPAAVYTVIAFVNGTATQKFTLGAVVILLLIFTAVNIIFKTHFRSFLWLAILAIYMITGSIISLLYVVAATSLADELVLAPLAKSFRSKNTINKQIDKRL